MPIANWTIIAGVPFASYGLPPGEQGAQTYVKSLFTPIIGCTDVIWRLCSLNGYDSLVMRLCRFLLVLVFAFPAVVLAQNEAASLSCWGAKGGFHSRSVRTPVFRSDAGLAYAEVSAKAITDGEAKNCSNTVRLFYSADGKDYRVVWHGHETFNGLGITIFGWSQSGKLFLFQSRTWPYDSDADEVHRGFVFDTATGKVRDLKLASAFIAVFGSKCEFMQTVRGWETDHSIVVRISRTPLTDHYEQVFCVKAPSDYRFDLSTSAATRIR